MNTIMQIITTGMLSGAVSFIMAITAMAIAIKKIKNEDNANKAKSNKIKGEK